MSRPQGLRNLASISDSLAEELYQKVTEHGFEGICLKSAEGVFLFAAPGFSRLIGYPSEVLIGRSAYDFLHPDDVSQVQREHYRCLVTMRPTEVLYRSHHISGKYVWLKSRIIPLLRSPEYGHPELLTISVDVTEQIEMQSSLDQSETDIHALFEATPLQTGVVELHGDRIVNLRANRRIAALFGLTPEQMVGKTSDDLGIPETRTREWLRRFRSAARGGKTENLQFEYRDTARKKVLTYSIHPAGHSPDGHPRFAYTIKDETELKAAEENLRNREALLLETQQVSEVGRWDWDLNTQTAVWSDELYRICEISPSDTAPSFSYFVRLVDPEDQKRVLDAIEAAIHEAQEIHIGFKMTLKSGRKRIMQVRGHPVKNHSGKSVRIVGTIQDVTELKQDEVKFKLLSEVSTALSSSLDLRASLTELGLVLSSNAAELCAIDLASCPHPPCRYVWTHRDPAKTLEQSSPPTSALAAMTMESGTSIIRNAPLNSGEMIESLGVGITPPPRSVIILPLRTRSKIIGALTLARWEMPAFTEQDRIFLMDLASRAALSIENAQLYDESKSALRLRDEFLGIVTHDLKNPISSVQLNSELISQLAPEGGEGTRIRKLARIIRNATQQMNHLIYELLDIGRIEAGTLPVSKKPYSAPSLLHESVSLLRPIAAEKAITIRIDHCANSTIFCDRDRLHQVLSNLVGNAIKFSPLGSEICINVEESENETIWSVHDEGIGISPQDLPKIFDRYWQAHRARRSGSGLGLSIVKGIVEALGGKVWATSEPGKGSIFRFTLPKAPLNPRDAGS